MARGAARLGDLTHGYCFHEDHDDEEGYDSNIGYETLGQIITASPDSEANNRGVARVGDVVLTDCNHISHIITGSPNSEANNRGIARLGDMIGDGPYDAIIITSSPDSEVN